MTGACVLLAISNLLTLLALIKLVRDRRDAPVIIDLCNTPPHGDVPATPFTIRGKIRNG